MGIPLLGYLFFIWINLWEQTYKILCIRWMRRVLIIIALCRYWVIYWILECYFFSLALRPFNFGLGVPHDRRPFHFLQSSCPMFLHLYSSSPLQQHTSSFFFSSSSWFAYLYFLYCPFNINFYTTTKPFHCTYLNTVTL